MKLIFQKKNLFDSIMKVQKNTQGKTTLPILECILIQAIDKKILLTSSDGELFIKREVQGFVEEEGEVAIESKRLSEIIRKMPENEDIIIEVDKEKNCLIKSLDVEFKIFGKDVQEFPDFPSYSKDKEIVMNEFTFKNIINQTIFSVGNNDLNKVFKGECFEIKNNILKVIALDTYRVAIRKMVIDKEYKEGKYIIPAKALNEVNRIIDGEVENVIKIYLSDRNIGFEFNNTVIVTPVIEGEFFNLERIIKNDYSTKININKKDFYETLDRCSIFSNEKKPVILDIKDKKINIRLQSLSGEYKDEVDINKSGNDLTIGFDTRHILDALKVIDEDNVNIYFNTTELPCYITDKIDKGNNEDYSYLYLIVPANIRKVN